MLYANHYILLIALWAPNPTLALVYSQVLSPPRRNYSLGIPHFSPVSFDARVRNISSTQAWSSLSGKDGFAYASTAGPKLIYLRPRGSGTVNAKGESPSSTRTFDHLPSEVFGIWPALFLFGTFLSTSALFLVYMLSSPQSLWSTFEDTANAWQCLSSAIDKLFLGIAELVFLFARFSIVSAIHGIYLGLIYTVTVVRECALRIEFFLERRRIQQWERQTQECIRRKSPKKLSHKVKRRSAEHSGNPLFSCDSLGSLTYLLLPEERNVLTRHMYDPRYFNKVKKIGSGAFGSIFLVEHRITGKLMATKVLLRSENTSDEINLEIRAMMRLQEKLWYPKLLSTFMDAENFYILMPYYCRGDLYAYMTSCGGCLHREQAKFYLAELFLAIQGLHKSGIIHRDLKPENILFGEDRHLVLADYGVATVLVMDEEDAFMEDEFPLWAKSKERGGDDFPFLTPSVVNPHTVVGVSGTVYYAAPEVIEGKEYSYGVDYYSMAVLYHEMVTGYVPLRLGSLKPNTDEPELILDLGRKDVHLQYMSVTDLHFMEKMLDRDPFARPNVAQMKAHPVFAGIDWNKLAQRKVPVPGPLALRKKVPISQSIEPVPTDQYGRRR